MRHTYRRGQKLEVQGDIQDYSCARDLKQRLVDFKFKLLNSKLLNCMWLSQALTGPLPVFLWLSMALCDSHSGSHWLSLPLSGILWPSLAHYCSLISRIQPLIGSQGPCSALSADATMTHFLLLWCAHKKCPSWGTVQSVCKRCGLNEIKLKNISFNVSATENKILILY